jgi:hypothetical protein
MASINLWAPSLAEAFRGEMSDEDAAAIAGDLYGTNNTPEKDASTKAGEIVQASLMSTILEVASGKVDAKEAMAKIQDKVKTLMESSEVSIGKSFKTTTTSFLDVISGGAGAAHAGNPTTIAQTFGSVDQFAASLNSLTPQNIGK